MRLIASYRIIKASSNPDEVVFDPFIGSGTTAVVALKLGRKVLGFDINLDYCKMVAERVESFMTMPRQPTLF